jgi:3',5'-cyclic AMP phosphodiesterase CpdA
MVSDRESPIFSFAIVADTHITEKEGRAIDGSGETGKKVAGMYHDLIERVNAMNPEFVVHLGDITHPGPASPEYGEAAQAFHKASEIFSMPYYLVPGNHDIGEKIHPALPDIDEQISISKPAVVQFEKHFGQQRYSFSHGGCLFLVFNSMLLNSGLEEEQEQWDWLQQTLSDNADKRVFLLAHYPLYLSSKDEPDHYDNIDQPARSRLIELLKPYRVEGYYAGHVHNFFYNHLDGMHQFVLPSTSIIRHDYQEFFQATPTREMGRFDPAKTGFFWVDVYSDRHVPYLIRASNKLPFKAHPWQPNGAAVTMDLRRPWCDEGDVATPWAVEIFERKYARNDYPLSALWEMGITDLRIPISDILDPRVSKRVKELSGLGHRFTVVMFGLPNEERRAALAEHKAGIKAVEVVALFSQWPDMIRPLSELRASSKFEIYLNPVRTEVQGWTTHHGLHADLMDEVEWVLEQSELEDAVDGFVFGIRSDMPPCDGYTELRRCLSGTSYKALLHVPCVGFDRTSAPTDEASRQHELARVAEAMLLARMHPDVSVVIDNFVELDRGYFNCRGLVDRLYNPNDGGRIVTVLNSLLPRQLGNLTIQETMGGRVLMAECDDSKLALVTARCASTIIEKSDLIPGEIAGQKGRLIELVNGKETAATLREVIACRASADAPQSPVLLLLEG